MGACYLLAKVLLRIIEWEKTYQQACKHWSNARAVEVYKLNQAHFKA